MLRTVDFRCFMILLFEGDADAYTARVLPTVSFTNVVGAYSVGKAPLLKQVQMIFSTI